MTYFRLLFSLMLGRGRSSSLLAICVFLTLAILAAPATAKPKLAGVFDLSGTPAQITPGPDGNVWVTISGSGLGNNLARIEPDGTVTEYSPTLLVNPVGITSGPDGNLWLTRNGGVVRVPPADPDSAQDFAVASLSDPRGITSGPGGQLWTASGDQLISFLPEDPAGADSLTVVGMGARGIAAAAGKLWIADFGGARVLSVDPDAPEPQFFDVGGGPQEVGAGPGKQIAFANPGAVPQTIGTISGTKVRPAEVPNTDPFGIAYAPDGNYWIADFATHDIALLPAGGGKPKKFDELPDNSGPRYLTAGPKGTIWVSLETSQQIARVRGLAPTTKITAGPKGKVKAGAGKTKVRFKFKSRTPKAKFECSIKGGTTKFKNCSSPQSYRLKAGKYTFIVRAKAGGTVDPSPAKRKFKVVSG